MRSSPVSDASLAARSIQGDDRAFAELARRYRGLIDQTLRRGATSVDPADQRQEALLGLFKACRAYDPARGRFGAIATTCVRRSVWEARVSARAGKHRVLTEALGLEHPRAFGTTIADRLPARDQDDPAVIAELRDEIRQRAARQRTAQQAGTERRRSIRVLRDYTRADVELALSLVADGKSVRQAAAAIGATHPTVLRWLRTVA